MSEARRRAERQGRAAERVAVWLLRVKGYRILAQRFRAPVGEIDIVATRGGALVCVEVKARADIESALASVSWTARRRIERAADLFAARARAYGAAPIRYDVIAVSGWRAAHRRNAWRFGD